MNYCQISKSAENSLLLSEFFFISLQGIPKLRGMSPYKNE